MRVAYHEAQIGFSEQRDVILLVANGRKQGWYPVLLEFVPQRTKRGAFPVCCREREPTSAASQLQRMPGSLVM